MFCREFALAARATMNLNQLRVSLVVIVVLCLGGLPVLGQEWYEMTEEDFKLTAGDVASADSFVRSVSVSGERLVVGASPQ